MIKPNIFEQYLNLTAAVSTRGQVTADHPYGTNMSFAVGDNVENVQRSRQEFFSALGIEQTMLAIPKQVHSEVIHIIETSGEYPSCDGLITEQQNVALVITVADCIPILLFDPKKKVIAAVHAGWRGTAKQIAMKALRQMEEKFCSRPEEIRAFIGPGAGRCCYNIGDEVAEQFQKRYIEYRDNLYYIDLKQINFHQLLEIGVQKQHIEVSQHCTICRPEIFHSFRRDGNRSGRMMATLMMK